MSNRLRAILPLALLAGLLAVPILMRERHAGARVAAASLAREDAVARYGVFFQEVSSEAGVDFTHSAPKLDSRLDHIMPQVASMGAGVSVVDFDRDGWYDLYFTNSGEGSQNALYRNRGDGTFEEVAAALGVADVNQDGTGVSMGAVWGDYDNDGYDDLFLYKWGRSELFHNDAGAGFTRVSEQAAITAWMNANTAVWFDYDRDGLLDLFVGTYYPADVNLWSIPHTRIMPESFEYAENGGQNYLFHNQGEGRFEEVATAMGMTSTRWTLAAAATDLDGSGYPDLVIADDYGVAEVYINQDGKRFIEAGATTGIGHAPKSGMNVSFGDVTNSGSYSIYISNISEEGVLIQGNNLWMPRKTTGKGIPVYDNLATAMGVELGGWSWGAQFGDLNNDGRVDLYLTNGYVSADPDRDYWYDFSKIAGGHRSVISDAKNWPAMEGRSLSGYQQKHVWLNDGSGRFHNVAQAVGVTDLFDGRAVALVDLWNRGRLDVVVANQAGPALIYRNDGADAGWVGFELNGTHSNRSAIGARVALHWDGQVQIQDVFGGSGYCAQNQRRVHFGVGEATAVDSAVVTWPSGITQTLLAPRLNEVHQLTEPASVASAY
ncbi:MAG TPA: CRTAC1 family protein [Rhodothermales bacterium]